MNTPTHPTTHLPGERARMLAALTGASYEDQIAFMRSQAEQAKASRDAYVNMPYADSATQAKGNTE